MEQEAWERTRRRWRIRAEAPLLLLRPSPDAPLRAEKLIWSAQARLPSLQGEGIEVGFQPRITAYRGQVLSGDPRGIAVHAATFIRLRRIVLESDLLRDPHHFRFILQHEVFHFVWVRLSNALRGAYTGLLAAERRAGARGELGESAAVHKEGLLSTGRRHAWRDYVCESFCDTAAGCFSFFEAEYQLAARWRERRLEFMAEIFGRVRGC